MKLIGKLVRETRIVKDAFVEKDESSAAYRDVLEDCFVALCRELDIPVPMWLKKNTTEFVNYHRTSFGRDQFVEKVRFDRFELKVE